MISQPVFTVFSSRLCLLYLCICHLLLSPLLRCCPVLEKYRITFEKCTFLAVHSPAMFCATANHTLDYFPHHLYSWGCTGLALGYVASNSQTFGFCTAHTLSFLSSDSL